MVVTVASGKHCMKGCRSGGVLRVSIAKSGMLHLCNLTTIFGTSRYLGSRMHQTPFVDEDALLKKDKGGRVSKMTDSHNGKRCL